MQDLTASLAAMLAALGDVGDPRRAAAGPASSRQLSRQIAETTARLDQARQWLASARAALAASQQDVADTTENVTAEKLTTGFADRVEPPGSSEGRVA